MVFNKFVEKSCPKEGKTRTGLQIFIKLFLRELKVSPTRNDIGEVSSRFS